PPFPSPVRDLDHQCPHHRQCDFHYVPRVPLTTQDRRIRTTSRGHELRARAQLASRCCRMRVRNVSARERPSASSLHCLFTVASFFCRSWVSILIVLSTSFSSASIPSIR